MSTRKRSFFDQITHDSHQVSKYAGDVSAYQKGGAPRLVQRVGRRYITRSMFAALRRGGSR